MKGCWVDSYRLSFFKKDQEKFDCPVHQTIKKYHKRPDSFGMCSFYIHGKQHPERSAIIESKDFLKILHGQNVWKFQQKKSSKWFCPVCQKMIDMSTDSVVCERCLK